VKLNHSREREREREREFGNKKSGRRSSTEFQLSQRWGLSCYKNEEKRKQQRFKGEIRNTIGN
jgi:hypothetical protein